MRNFLPFILLISLFLNPPAFSQQNNQWIFGNHAGIDFNSGTATPFYNSNINALEGSASVSDANGNLLFYSDGLSIWDRNNQLMPNGTGLGGGYSSTTVIALQRPGNCSQYYVFTTQDHTQSGNFYYSVVDMCLNSSNGDVVSGSKAVLIQTNCSEKICLIPNTNGNDYWLVTHELSNSRYNVYQITSSGIGAIPASYDVGASFSYTCQAGYLKANNSGTKIAVTTFWENICQVVDFDPSTGAISNPVNLGPVITSDPNPIWYGLQFSPNENFLYATRAGYSGIPAYLYQINLSDSSYTTLSTAAIIPVNYYYGALRLAPDSKIYMARSSTDYLGVINYPDSAGAACDYVDLGLALSASSNSELGLSTDCFFPSSPYSLSLGNDTSLCSSYDISLSPTCDMSFLWQDGSTDSSFTITTYGTCWVQATSPACGNFSDTIIVTSGLGGQVTGDTAICVGDTTTLTASAALSYEWNTGDTTQSIIVSPSTTTEYWVLLSDTFCADSISTTVFVHYPPKIYLYLDDDTICIDHPAIILTGQPPGGVFSGDGVTGNIFDPAVAGLGLHTLYYAYTDANGCIAEIGKDIFVDVCTGLQSLSSLTDVFVFPSPFSNDLFISTGERNFTATLFNEIGKECLVKKFSDVAENGAAHISCENLSAGIYFLLIRSSNGFVMRKVEKQ